jgi:hypothetical protein
LSAICVPHQGFDRSINEKTYIPGIAAVQLGGSLDDKEENLLESSYEFGQRPVQGVTNFLLALTTFLKTNAFLVYIYM